jgi:uncharacterized LabA/DUF88 family protein
MARGGVAIFADWTSFKQQLEAEYHTEPDINKLLTALERLGPRIVAKAYADWTNSLFQADGLALHKHGIEAIHVDMPDEEAGNNTNDNASHRANVRLAAETVDLCHTRGELTVFVIISGDEELTHVANVIKRNRRRVVVVRVSDVGANALSDSADETLYYDRDIAGLLQGDDGDLPPTVDRAGLTDAFGWAEELLKQAKSKGLSLANLEHVMLHLYNFNPGSFDLTFQDFMAQMQQAGRVEISQEGQTAVAKLPAGGVKPRPAPAASPAASTATSAAASATAKQAANKTSNKASNATASGIAQEIDWVIAILREKGKPQALNNVVKELRARHNFKAGGDFRSKVGAAQKKGLLKLGKNKANDQWYLGLGPNAK